jgi:phosphinothricin acetyltransferase
MTDSKLKFRPLEGKDWEQVVEIYRQGIETGDATFELNVPNWVDWNNGHLKTCRIVVELEGVLVAWAALSPVSKREVYKGVAEVSVYVSDGFSGQQIGTKLLTKLIAESEENGIWTLQASIFPENKGSLKIHKKLGFREVGYRERIAKMKGIWRNTIYLERRSTEVGMG